MKKECDHQGKWGGLGSSLLILPGGQKILIIHSLFCKDCGHTEARSMAIGEDKSPIAKPNIIFGPPTPKPAG